MKYFTGKIADKKLSDFAQYDASLNKYSDRLELALNLINGENGDVHEFLTTYFTEYYDASPTQNGWMAEQDSVCKMLEGLGTYLLNAKDIESNRKVKYRFWKSEKEFNQYKESENITETAMEASVEGKSADMTIVDMFYNPDSKNYKEAKDMKLFAKDIRDIQEIARLQDMIDKTKSDSFVSMVERKIDAILPIVTDEKDKARLISIRKNVQNYVDRWATDMRENQIAIKVAIKRPVDFKNVLKDEGCDKNWEQIVDLNNVKAIQIMLEAISSRDLMGSEFELILWDLHEFIASGKVALTGRQQDIFKLLAEGWKQIEIGDALGMKKGNVSREITKIAEKIKGSMDYSI